tara:strand:+ start:1508 stop:3097 length:1590 start_codon:yes stop_codon:yes gene_type:complete
MKYIYSFFIIFLITTNSLFSQIKIVDNADLSNFPEIEFSINNRNPTLLSSSSFNVSELINGRLIESDSVTIYRFPNDSTDYSKNNKCVLILLESLVHDSRKEQNLTFRASILEVLDKVVNTGDKFKIVTFSLKDGETNILNDVNTSFTDSISLLKKDLENHKTKSNDFTNKPVSDIYGAIIQGISQLEAFSTDLPKSILLLSEERNNSKIDNLSSNAVTLANDKGIVINTIKYNRSRYHQWADPTLAEKTFGISKVLNKKGGDMNVVNEEKKLESTAFIKSILDNVVQRSLGLDYNIVLKLNDSIKDGKNHEVQIKINNNDNVLKLNYKAPGNWVIAQFQINFLIAVIVSLILIIILGFLIYFISKRYKINLQNKLNVIKQQKQKEEEQEASILAQKEELLKIKNQQEKIKIEEAEDLRILKEKALIKQMLSTGSFPILKFSDSKTSLQFEINNPIIKIGRDKVSNNICIANKNISRNHFSIVFKNNQYKVKDNNSTNGIKLNGRKIKESVIKHADIIEIADLSFTFYE